MNALTKIEEKPEVSIIIVNYNDKVHLGECLSVLEKSPLFSKLELIVIDNNSSDGSQELIRTNFSQVNLICNLKNIGFAQACNQGARKSRRDFLLFLNTDAILYPEALSLMLQEIKTNHQAAAVGPALFMGENHYQVSFGRKVSFASELIQKYFFNPYYRIRLKGAEKKKEVGWLSGACLLTRRKALEEVGFFDENFFLYFEDIDLCFRIREKGWKLIYFPQAKVFHRGGTTTAPLGFSSRYEYRRSQLYFYHKYNSNISLFLLRFYLLVNFSFLFLWQKLRKNKDSVKLEKFFELLKIY